MSAADLHLNMWPAPQDLMKFFTAPNCDPTRLIALCLWREARGELGRVARIAVGCTVRNRTKTPARYGVGYAGVILRPLQYSSFNANDPQYKVFPKETDQRWQECIQDAMLIRGKNAAPIDDPTEGATHYFDSSMDKDPPKWATDGELMHKVDIDHLRFYGPAFPESGDQADGHAGTVPGVKAA